MKQKALDATKEAMDNKTTEKDIAAFIKQTFDKLDEGESTWHCIVGTLNLTLRTPNSLSLYFTFITT